MSTSVFLDLTDDSTSAPAASSSNAKKRTIDAVAKPAKKQAKPAKKETPHALLWICAAGKGQGRAWKAKALKVIGIYKNKAAAEQKKEQLIDANGGECGHGDIVVGDSWEDEIDLVVRPVEEVSL